MAVPIYIDNVVPGQGLPPSTLADGSCRSTAGIKIMDKMLESVGNGKRSEQARDDARKLCRSCPVKRECDEWVTRAERPAGSWHGMYAGLLPLQRKRRAKEAREISADGAASAS